MRLLVCAGGTGGGVYPALAVLQALASNANIGYDGVTRALVFPENVSVLWVGSVGGMETELVKRSGVSYEAIPAAGVHGVGLRALPGNVLQLGRGYKQAKRVLHDFRPDALFFTGGYVAVPMALAGRKVPSVLYVPDIEPGLALKTLARFADRIAVTAEESRTYFPNQEKIVVSGYPVRQDLAWNKEKARQVLGLTANLPTLLVFGGSKGARSINRALVAVLPQLLADMQIVHVSGKLDWPEVEAAKIALENSEYRSLIVGRYRAFPYLHDEMGAAFCAADLALCRAGASTLGEFPATGLPAILVPYPHAWRYQRVNAHYMERHGAAMVIEDDQLAAQILPTVKGLILCRERLVQMSQAMRSLARSEAARSIAQLLANLAQSKPREGLAL